MENLTAYEKGFVQAILKNQLRQTKDYVKENSNTLERRKSNERDFV